MFIFATLPAGFIIEWNCLIEYDFLMMDGNPPESLAAMTKPTSTRQNLPTLALWLVVASHSGIDLLRF